MLSEILSDRSKVFLSGLMTEVERLLGSHHVSTTEYHPQSHVVHFNHTLTAILAKLALFQLLSMGYGMPWRVFGPCQSFPNRHRSPTLKLGRLIRFDCNSSFAIFVLYECFLLLGPMHLQACSQAHCHTPSNLIDFVNEEGSTQNPQVAVDPGHIGGRMEIILWTPAH